MYKTKKTITYDDKTNLYKRISFGQHTTTFVYMF